MFMAKHRWDCHMVVFDAILHQGLCPLTWGSGSGTARRNEKLCMLFLSLTYLRQAETLPSTKTLPWRIKCSSLMLVLILFERNKVAGRQRRSRGRIRSRGGARGRCGRESFCLLVLLLLLPLLGSLVDHPR